MKSSKFTPTFFLFIFTFISINLQSQIQVFEALEQIDPQTGDELSIEEALILTLMGSSYSQLDISSIEMNCPPESMGYFNSFGVEDPDGIFELTHGVVMSTGCLEDIPGPNSGIVSGVACGDSSGDGDADLSEISGVNTNDACILEFDIKAFGNAFEFNYVFGSEEYDNYVCSQFNDVFAFFITGPNPNGGEYENFNIALIPGTDLPVAINTVNDGESDSNTSPSCLLEYSEHYAGESTYTDFEGLTNTFSAHLEVLPCETYHLKLAIADGSDSILDSGVFIEAGSLEAQPRISIVESGGIDALNLMENGTLANYFETTDGSQPKVLIENCNTREINFDLGEIDQNCTLYLEIGGSAENGIDYTDSNGEMIPDLITFTPEQSSKTLEFIAHGDQDNEVMETIVLRVVGIDGMSCNNEDLIIKTQVIHLIDEAAAFTKAFAIRENNQPIAENTQVPVNAIGGDAYHWFPEEYFENPNQKETEMFYLEGVQYGCEISNNACTETVYLRILDATTGLSSLEELGIDIYPNPVVDYLNLSGIKTDFIAKIYDQNGKQIMESSETKIDFSFLDAGLYFITLEIEGQRYFEKILK